MAEIAQERIQSFAFVIGVCMCAVLAVVLMLRSPGGSGWSGRIQLDDKINPNDATTASLLRLPDIGLARAHAIVAYRENLGEKEGNGPAFQDVNDLQKVRGIGPRTAQDISQWLKFE
jgi:competence ComEA-like helix-hairpin-helix protein